jgi:hypothetical protein
MSLTRLQKLFFRRFRSHTVFSLQRLAVAAVFLMALGNHASAEQGRALTVYEGFRDGGSFDDDVTGNSVSVRSSESYAASLDFPLDEGRQFQVFYSFQNSSLGLDSILVNATPDNTELPLHIMYLHFGGTSYITGEVGHGAYVVGGFGASLFDPTTSGFDSELRLSANVGLGYQQPLGKNLALRFEARGYFTLFNSSGGVFCSGGCTIAISGQTVVQGEVAIGIAFGL